MPAKNDFVMLQIIPGVRRIDDFDCLLTKSRLVMTSIFFKRDLARCYECNYVAYKVYLYTDLLQKFIKHATPAFIADVVFDLSIVGQLDLIKMVLAQHKELDINVSECLSHAAHYNQYDVVEFMLARVDPEDTEICSTLFAVACERGCIPIIRIAMRYGICNLNEGLSAACRYEQREVVKLMLELGADECLYCDK